MTKGKAFPRILLSAPYSGSGKTLCTLALLVLLREKGFAPVGFKCGPDFIDPLFHERVLNLPSRNLDLFLAKREGVLSSLGRGAEEGSFGVMEGVMGLFDGMSPSSITNSTYAIGRETDTPVILILPARGMSRSALALLKGFLSEDSEGRIKGVLINRVSLSFGRELKRMIEEELGLPVVGILPENKEFCLESRHLGLVLPEEIPKLQKIVQKAAEALKETLDLACLLEIAKGAGAAPVPEKQSRREKRVKVGVAKDEAFCFYYRENLELLEELGAELFPFSPIHDEKLPEVSRLLFGGGYPELQAKALAENKKMREAVRQAALEGMPILGECGGYLYLLQSLVDLNGRRYPMAGVLPGEAFYTGRLSRFGYVEVEAAEQNPRLPKGDKIRGHEFHYYDVTEKGESCIMKKPGKDRQWKGGQCVNQVFAGFPHLYYPSCRGFAEKFLC